MDTPATHVLASQVGGHAGVMTTEDGSLLIKPALHRELEFYQSLQRDPALEALREFTPKFLGTLTLQEAQASPDAPVVGVVVEPIAAQKDKSFRLIYQRNDLSIVLENLSFPFLKPNILDVKLGTVLYDETASADKVARMEKTARDTTSYETGVRLTGFQVYDNITSQPVNTPKTYGKSIKVSELGDGIAKFFPLGITPVETEDAATPSSGLPRKLLLPILEAIREEIAEIRKVYAELEIRMVGGSLLVIYEADWDRAAESLQQYLQEKGEDCLDDDDDDEDDDDDDDKKPGPPFAVKLIDFAHTSFVPGKGPDEGVLRGIDTVLKLLDERLEALGSN
ncbi:hypothetical protein B0H34DRAFT_794504 [Crassisporium funariophilum]|nr:hypothetical protein B0H34DRAFT_794504 [Crassisporium funariophilum]